MSMTPSLLVSPEQDAGQSSQLLPSPSQLPPMPAHAVSVRAWHPDVTQQAPDGEAGADVMMVKDELSSIWQSFGTLLSIVQPLMVGLLLYWQ